MKLKIVVVIVYLAVGILLTVMLTSFLAGSSR